MQLSIFHKLDVPGPLLDKVQTDTTTPYNMQQGVQTDETCNIQQ